MRGNWRFAAARLRNSGEYAIIVVKMLWFLGDSVDSRHSGSMTLAPSRPRFLGDSVDSRLKLQREFVRNPKPFLGDSVDSRHGDFRFRLYSAKPFLGDSVDSRLNQNELSILAPHSFWGIVWTAGLLKKRDLT